MLTKSDIQSLRQCPRNLWLERNRPDLIPTDDPTLYRRATDGNIVGQKARESFGNAAIRPAGSADAKKAATDAIAQLKGAPNKSAVEVPLVRDDVYARADALVSEKQGYVLQETKSSTFPLKRDKVTADSPEEHHVEDVAIQAWVMESSGLPMIRAELNLLNNQWKYPGGGDYTGLFRRLDISQLAAERKASVPEWIAQGAAALRGEMPAATTGRQCKEPYPCPFKYHCVTLDPPGEKHPITLLPDKAGKDLARKLTETKGYVSILQPAPEELTGNQATLYRRIQTAHRTGNPVLEPDSGATIAALPYPRYYFDFEGIDLPVPRWAGVRPYEHVPFQWSCHVEPKEGVYEHHAFLDLSGDDPSLACIARMREVIDPNDGGPIIVYYQTYEKQRLEELAKRHPDHAAVLQLYIGRLFDLHPVVKQNFYDARMAGSFSIKKVLLAVAPELDYEELDEVQEGTGAQVAYLHACFEPNTSQERRLDLRDKLLQYCAQDTWAMVEIAFFLQRLPRPTGARPAPAAA